MKKIFSLLGLLMLLTSSAWAETTTLYQRGDGTAWSNADLTDWTNTNCTPDISDGLHVGLFNAEWSTAKSITPTENAIVTVNATINGAKATGRNGSYDFVQVGGVSFRIYGQDKKAKISIEGTETELAANITRGADYNISFTINTATGDVKYSYNGGDEVETTTKSTTAISNIEIGHHKGGGEATGWGAFDVTLKKINVTNEEQDVTSANYTINYKLGSTIVKTTNGKTAIDSKVYAEPNFYVENQKYFVQDGATTEFVIAQSGNNFDVAVREADNFSYTVNAVAGSMSTVIAQGTVVEGESASVAYPQYVNVDGTLYKSTKQGSNPWWGVNVTPTSDNFVYNINYTQAATGIVICYEVEGIKGATVVTTGNADIRCSNKAGGFFADANGGVVTKLQPGVYKLFTSVWGNAGATLTFKAGEKTILEAETKGYIQDYNTEEFIISEPTDIIMVGGSTGNAPKIADFVYIQKTADYVATENLTINDAEITIGQNTQMSATLNPSNASNKTLTWTIKESNSINAGEAEIDAATGEITPLKAGLIAVEVTNGEKTDFKVFTIAAAQFDATITGVPESFENPVEVIVGEDKAENGETLFVSTKEGYDNMQNTSLLQPVGSVTATKIPTYIYSITVDKKNKTVDVVYEEDIEVTAMNFEVTDQRIALGNSRTLQVTYSPANASFKTAKWTSSNPEVATVDENTGLVTAVSEGETTITAEWSENAEHGTNISTQMTLTVDKGLVVDRIVYDELDDATAEVMGYYHPMDGDTLFLPAYIESNGRMIPVSFIKQEAFIGSNLKSIVIPGTVKTIDHRALMYSNTHNAYNEMPEEGLESAFLLEGVEVMRDRIFHGNKYMKKVFLPSTLTDIGYYSFFDTAIEDVYFGGTEEQWNALKNLENAKLPETAKIHFDSDFTTAFINSIEVEEDYAEIAVGEEYEIEASIIPEEIAPVVALTYTSSNEEVATVDEEGVVTGIADGYVTITVSAGEGVEAKVRVKVGDPVQERENVLTMDFEDGEVADYWALAIAESQLVEPTAEGSTGRAAAVVSGSDRGDYVKVNADLEGATKYEVSMDLLLMKSPKTTQFSVLNASSWDTWTTNWGMFWKDTKAQSHNPFLFNMDIPASNTANINTDFDADGNAIPAQQTWDFENGVWYTLTLAVDVNAHTVDYAIAPKSDLTAVAVSGTYTAPADEMMQIKGIYERNGRYNYSPGAIAIDNVIVDVTERGFVEGQGGNQATGINEAKAEESVKNGKYVENGQIVIYIDGKKFNAAGQELK